MIKETLEDGTVVKCEYSEGGEVRIYCACGAHNDEDDPLYLYPSDYAECPGCGKRYETSFVPRIELLVNGSYETTF